MSDTSKPTSDLSPAEKRALLARLLQEKANQSESLHPLSYGQRALWFLHKLVPESAAYNISFAVRIRTDVDKLALQRAFQALIDRHPSLRTTFPTRDGKAIQHVHPHLEICFNMIDASMMDRDTLNKCLIESAHHPFDLEPGPLLRVNLFTRSAQEQILLVTVHHIIGDFWSLGILLDELRILYAAEKTGMKAPLPSLTLQYTDYIGWQSKMLAAPAGERLWLYWQKQLSSELPVLNLPADRPRPKVQTYCGTSYDFKLKDELIKKINTLGKGEGATPYVTILAAFFVLLHRCTGQEDILVGSPAVGRSRFEFERIVGYFVNPIIIRADLSGNPPFTTFLNQVRQTVLAALEHQDYPFPLLVERLHPPRDPGRSPLFQVEFVWDKTHQLDDERVPPAGIHETASQKDRGELELEFLEIKQRGAAFDLTLRMLEFDGSLSVIFQYNTDLFDTAAIVRMAGHFQTLLEAIVENPQQRLAHLPLLTESERHQLVVEWNDTRKIYSGDLCVHRVFEARVELTPHSTAVVYEDETLTYHELNSRARKLSYYLQKSGVGPDLLIAIYMERSLEMVVGIYGILKAGAAYVPLEAAYPKKRLAFILEDTRAPLLLTQQRLIKGLPHHGSKTLVCLDSNWSTIDKESVDNPVNYTMPRDLAYVIYTSGSTGKPKGAMNSHRGICNRLTWMQDAYQLTTGDRVLQKTPFSFDVSVWEFFWPLFTGASLVVARPGGHLDSAYLVKLIADEKITTLHFVPSMLRVFLEEQGLEACGCLKRVICSGEALPFKLQERFFAHLPAELHNLYGPTEAAVDVTYWACKRENVRQIVPIGRPISNIQIYILDSYLQPVPIGITGELHIGGIGLARGYCNRPELTAEKFIPGLISDKPGARWYKTGDLARYLPDGNIEFLGRLDYQVKIRGFRIELEEIETLLRQHPAVRETIVVTREDAPNDKRLAAYLVPNQKPAPTTSELRSFLETKLPDYMVPATFVILDTLTLTPNGKVDRRALPVPDGLRPELETAYVEPRTEVEHALVEVWKKVLQVKKVGMYDNFFDLGGHSLLMVQVHNMLREMFKQDMSVIELFKYPTISSMAKYLTQRKSEPSIFKNSDDLVEKIKEGKDRLKQQFKRKQLAARRGGN